MTHPGALPELIPLLNYEGSPLWTRPFLFTPSFCDCSDHGRCMVVPGRDNVSRTICVCDEGWTGFSDFMDARGASCHVNTMVVDGLWALNLCFWVVSLIMLAPKLRSLVVKHYETKDKLRLKGRTYNLTDNQGLFSIFLGMLVCMPGMVLVGVLRLAYPTARVAIDGVITFFWFVGRFGMGLSTAIHQPALMKQMLRAQSSADQVIRDYDRYGKILAWFQAAAALWSIPVLATRGQYVILSRICFGLFCAQVAVAFTLLSRQAAVLRETLYKILTESAKSMNNITLINLRDQLCDGQSKIRKQTLLQACIYATWAVVPPLWLTYDYMLPISWLTPPVLLYNVVSAIYHERQRHDASPTSQNNASKPKTSTQRDDDDNRKAFEMPKSIIMSNESKGYTSWAIDATNVVEVTEPDDKLLTATGMSWTRLNILRSLKQTTTPIPHAIEANQSQIVGSQEEDKLQHEEKSYQDETSQGAKSPE